MLDTDAALSAQVRLAFIATALVAGVATAWATLVPLDSAVTAPGVMVVESNIKKVQHQTGGIVGEIKVAEGQRVEAGEIIVRLDETSTRAALAIIRNDRTAGLARQARLVAERDGAAVVTFPAELRTRAATEPDVQAAMDEEASLFATRLKSRQGQRAQLMERIGQLREEIGGLETQLMAARLAQKVAQDEFARLKPTQLKGLVPLPRITSLEREIARNDGSIGDLVGRVASSKGKIAEIETQITQLERDHQTEVNKDLREVATKLSEVAEKQIAAEDQLRRIDIRAPATGQVQQLSVNTVGGIVSPQDVMMIIVPENQPLVVDVRINPPDIDQISLAQPARVRFSAFNQRTTPELKGTVFRMSRDILRDPQTGQTYYMAGIRVPDDEIARLGGLKLQPGMPAEVFIVTGSRTFASYITKPITDGIPRTFGER